MCRSLVCYARYCAQNAKTKTQTDCFACKSKAICEISCVLQFLGYINEGNSDLQAGVETKVAHVVVREAPQTDQRKKQGRDGE